MYLRLVGSEQGLRAPGGLASALWPRCPRLELPGLQDQSLLAHTLGFWPLEKEFFASFFFFFFLPPPFLLGGPTQGPRGLPARGFFCKGPADD